MNPKQILISVMETLGFVEGKTFVLQGSINPGEAFPDTFATFWTDYTSDDTHFDNNVHSVEWAFSVILYSNDPEIVNTKPDEIRTALKAAGFIPQGKGQDVASGEPTHTGWAMDYIFVEENNF